MREYWTVAVACGFKTQQHFCPGLFAMFVELARQSIRQDFLDSESPWRFGNWLEDTAVLPAIFFDSQLTCRIDREFLAQNSFTSLSTIASSKQF